MLDPNCLFCKIISGEISADKIYESENSLAFLDINPVNLGHTLVVPKKHTADLTTADQTILKNILTETQKVALAVMAGVGAKGFNLIQNNLKPAGQIIDHLHFHIIPRHEKDGLKHWKHKNYKENEAERVAKKIRSKLGA